MVPVFPQQPLPLVPPLFFLFLPFSQETFSCALRPPILPAHLRFLFSSCPKPVHIKNPHEFICTGAAILCIRKTHTKSYARFGWQTTCVYEKTETKPHMHRTRTCACAKAQRFHIHRSKTEFSNGLGFNFLRPTLCCHVSWTCVTCRCRAFV